MWNFIKLLGISSYTVTMVCQDKTCILARICPRTKTAHCPHCGVRSSRVKSYGREQSIAHGIILGKPVYLFFRRRRFTCPSCTHIFSEAHPLLPLRARATHTHKKEVVDNLADRSFSSTTKRYNISYGTQRRWLNELVTPHVLNFDIERQEQTPFTLGIDEVSFAGRDLVTTVGNITTHRLKGVLHSRRKDELKKTLRNIPETVKPLITEVVIDMCELYLRAVAETLPQAAVVVDHFHIIHDANHRIDQERLILQDLFKKRIPRYLFTTNKEDLKSRQIQQLAAVIKQYPELSVWYQTKERLRDMYRAATKEEAAQKLTTIIASLKSSDDGSLMLWGRTLSRWKPYILNYWNSRSTNGYMEGMHNKMKLIKRISFGFRNKEVFINKVMLSVLLTTVLVPYLKS